MISLIHSRNISDPNFKLNDSSLYRDQSNQNPTSPETPLVINSNIHYRPNHKSISNLSNVSFSSQNPNDILRSINQKLNLISLHSPKNKPNGSPLLSPKVSIGELYGSPNNEPFALNKSKLASEEPSLFLVREKSVEFPNIYRSPEIGSPIPTIESGCTSPKSSFLNRKRRAKLQSIGQTIVKQDKFQQYLEYLNAGNTYIPKEKFERHLQNKYNRQLERRSKKSLDTSEGEAIGTGAGSLLKFPSFCLNAPSLLLPQQKEVSFCQNDAVVLGLLKKDSLLQRRKRTISISKNASPMDSYANSYSPSPEHRDSTTNSPLKQKRATKNFAFGGFSKQSTKNIARPAEHDAFFKQLSMNLQDLYQLVGNDQKINLVLEKISQHNAKVMSIISPKFHKVNDFDAGRLEAKFSMIEVMTEILTIPQKLQKKRDGITLIDPHLMDELGEFNRRAEEFNIEKRKEHLRLMEDKLKQSREILQDFKAKKIYQIQKKGQTKGGLKSFYELQGAIDETINFGANMTLEGDPMSAVEKFQRNNGDFKHLSRKNIEHARGVSNLFSRWLNHPKTE